MIKEKDQREEELQGEKATQNETSQGSKHLIMALYSVM